MPSTTDLERLFNLVVDPLCIAGFDGYFKQINPAWARTLGYTEDELLAKPYLDFVHPDDREPTVGAAADVSSGVTVLEFRNRYRAKDGTYRWLAWNAFPSAEDQLIYAVARDKFFSRQSRKPDQDILELFDAIGSQIGQFLERLKVEELKNKVTEAKLYLEQEIHNEYFGDIVGESAPLKNVLEQIETVAKTDATVLILGETGTGKELIARALHNESNRKTRTFVKLNCSAIPTGLLESELFGHEKGAFTGAIAQKLGRLELADKGTLFLDEIGDIPLELQPKLLRALQEHEFERLGSTRTLRVDFRLIAATNRDLTKMVADREFRSDLFYRLNVFPIHVPPLRARTDDLPRLVRHFASKYAQ